MTDGKTIIEEVDFAEDVQEFITVNEDVVFTNPEIKAKVLNTPKDVLLKVIKEIGSKVKILDANEFNEEFLAKNF